MSRPGKQREYSDDKEHSRGQFGDSIGYGAYDESTRSQREYSVDASGMQMRIYHAEQERRQACDA